MIFYFNLTFFYQDFNNAIMMHKYNKKKDDDYYDIPNLLLQE